MVIITFTVDDDGSIVDAKIVRDLNGGCGQAALDIVNSMNGLPEKWTPGKRRGKSVKVLYTIPVRFKLQK